MNNVLAIDVGYGHVKWVSINAKGETKKGMFPSVAALTTTTTRERTAESSGMSTPRTVTVNVGEHNYVVGRDAYLQTDAHFARTRLSEYSQTDGYKALMLGAMAISGLREIDQLVIGLPLTTLSIYHGQLQQTYKGEHFIGAAAAKRECVVTIDNVTVTSQPAGAIVHSAKVNETLRKKTSLVIDVGYFTVDYLMCQGLRPYYARSGAIEGGMSGFYEHLGSTVAEQLADAGFARKCAVDHFRLEKALSEGVVAGDGSVQYTLMVGNQAVDITDSVKKSKIKVSGYLDRIVTGMGSNSLETINSIVLAGGGGGFVKEELQARGGRTHEIVELQNAQFAVAQGYAAMGVANLKKMAASA